MSMVQIDYFQSARRNLPAALLCSRLSLLGCLSSRRHLTGGHHLRSLTYTTRSQAFRMLANPNLSSGVRNSNKEVIMVDPLEAKRLAAKQMEEIKAKEKLERRRQIEAINGAWAMIGLTAGLVIEGQTGKGILGQLGGYWHAIESLFVRLSASISEH